jgi:hypothetical protein
MQIEVGIVAAGIFLIIVAIFQAVEQRRTASAYREALGESKARADEVVQLQRETNRLLALIAERMDAQQK